MAEYSNLTSLEGLEVGDKVVYLANDDFVINLDPKSYKFKIEMHAGIRTGTGYSGGGLTTATIDTSKLADHLTFCAFRRSLHVSYGTFSNYASCLYHRILVAGARGRYPSGGGGNGGGIKGADGASGTGATQTSGGSRYSNGMAGRFGYGGANIDTQSYLTATFGGGDGWYGGGSGNSYVPGGGSGFIIGTTTTTYPAGYMNDDVSLQDTIISAISDASTVQGGSTYNGNSGTEYRMIITILEAPVTKSTKFKYYKDSNFIDTNVFYYDGTKFIKVKPSIYKNGQFLS